MSQKPLRRMGLRSQPGCVSAVIAEARGDFFNEAAVRLLRYPGGKQRILNYLLKHLPARETIKGRFVEPFVGGGAIFFALAPRLALLADANVELIDLYRGLRRYPKEVWERFCGFPSSKT